MSTPFSFPLDRPDVHLTAGEELTPAPAHAEQILPSGISVSAEAAARLFANAAKRIRNRESVKDVCSEYVDVVIALSGRI